MLKNLLAVNLKKYYLLILAVVVAMFLIFANLDARVFWADEAQTANVAATILKYGLPTFFDGKNLIVDHPFDLDLNQYISDKLINYEKRRSEYKLTDYLWKWQPWLQHYLIALGYLIFGINTFAARFPFAASGILVIIVLYFFVTKLFKNKELADISLVLLIAFVPFYLYVRQARYYSLAMLFSILALYAYLKLIDDEKYSKFYFIFSNVILFYSFYAAFFGIYSSIIIHAILFNRNIKFIKRFIVASIPIFILTFPWFLYTSLFSKTYSFQMYHFIFGFFYLLSYVFLYMFPAILLVFVPFIIAYKKNNKIYFNSGHSLLLLAIFLSTLIALFGPWDLPSFRYISFLIPFFIIEIAALMQLIKKYSKLIFLTVFLLFIFTNFLFIFPFKFFESTGLKYVEKNSDEYYYIKENLQIRYNFFDYIHEITHNYRGPNEVIVNFLRKNSKENETFITNADYAVYAFYTNMKFESDMNKNPDWVILREPYFLWGGAEGEGSFLFNLTYKGYEKIIFNSTDYIYLLDSPEPRKHRFKSNYKLELLDRYETYPITIYRKYDE